MLVSGDNIATPNRRWIMKAVNSLQL